VVEIKEEKITKLLGCPYCKKIAWKLEVSPKYITLTPRKRSKSKRI
jgi:hypothetical protein